MKLVTPSIPRESWNSPTSDYKLVSLETCKFLFDQAQKYFDETSKESEELTQRSSRILFTLFPGSIGIIGFCLTKQELFRPISNISFLLYVAATGSLIYCLRKLLHLIGKKNMHYRGTLPEQMIRPEIIALKDESQIESAFYISEIERLQLKIEQMTYWNFIRVNCYEEVIKSLATFTVLGVLAILASI